MWLDEAYLEPHLFNPRLWIPYRLITPGVFWYLLDVIRVRTSIIRESCSPRKTFEIPEFDSTSCGAHPAHCGRWCRYLVILAQTSINAWQDLAC